MTNFSTGTNGAGEMEHVAGVDNPTGIFPSFGAYGQTVTTAPVNSAAAYDRISGAILGAYNRAPGVTSPSQMSIATAAVTAARNTLS